MKRVSKCLKHFANGVALIGLLANGIAFSQGGPQRQTASETVNQSDDPILKHFHWRSIGPASMGGRIDDITAVDSNPSIIYVGAATGGVWKTTNNGTTWTPIFDTYSVCSVGDLAVSQSDPNILWVGTGEPNNRQSATWGDGIYKSSDGGKTFINVGLKETQTIARIVIDPKDNNTVYVAALGHLFGPNKHRGIYKTSDGGKNWTNVKFIDEDTGFTDLAIDPSDSKTLYAASYQRRRTPWGFNGGGPGSALWKTSDAGKTWVKIEGSELPKDVYGRIGLDVSRSNPNVVVAQIEVGPSAGAGGGEEQPGEPGAGGPGAGGPGGGAGARGGQQGPPDPKKSGVWRSEDKGKTWKFMSNNNNRPMYYSQIRIDPKNDKILYTGGLNVSKSLDGGKTFQVLQGVAHSDHHAIWIDPQNDNHVIIGNDGGLDVTYDQGASWEFVNTIALSQAYAIAADMRKPYYVYCGLQDNGTWGGPTATRNNAGITNPDWYRVGGGDGFYVQVDPTDYNTVYVESQGGNMLRLDMRTGRNVNIKPRAAPRPRDRGRRPGAEPPPNPPRGGQGEEATSAEGQPQGQRPQPQQGGGGFGRPTNPNIVPAPPVGEEFRFNWSTPIQISPHNPRTIYTGANKFFKSVDRGETWTASADLTKAIDRNKLPIMGVPGDKPMASKHDGTGNYGNITTLAESPHMPGVIWVGTDDGNIQVSRDGGSTWTNVAKNIQGIPDTHQISRVEPSHFEAGTCYVTIDGHRNEDFKPYIFITRDFGATWKSLSVNLPSGHVNVIREDPKNKNLLFAGTEFGLYVSLNGGGEWKRFMSGLPTVRVDDILVHPRDHDLIAGTHGRGLYVMDDITPLEEATDKVIDADVHLFDVRSSVALLNDVTLSRSAGGAKQFRGTNPQPGTAISYYLKSAPSGDVKITISDITGKVIRNLNGTKEPGINRVQWNLRGDAPARADLPGGGQGRGAGGGGGGAGGGGGGGGGGGFGGFGVPPVEPGTYLVKLSVGGKDYTSKVTVEPDQWKDQ